MWTCLCKCSILALISHLFLEIYPKLWAGLWVSGWGTIFYPYSRLKSFNSKLLNISANIKKINIDLPRSYCCLVCSFFFHLYHHRNYTKCHCRLIGSEHCLFWRAWLEFTVSKLHSSLFLFSLPLPSLAVSLLPH